MIMIEAMNGNRDDVLTIDQFTRIIIAARLTIEGDTQCKILFGIDKETARPLYLARREALFPLELSFYYHWIEFYEYVDFMTLSINSLYEDYLDTYNYYFDA